MNYLMQYIQEIQVKYPNIALSPVDVLNHMLYCNGNGVEFLDGNPVMVFMFTRTVPFKFYYRENIPLKQMIEGYDDRNSESEIESKYKTIKRRADIFKQSWLKKHTGSGAAKEFEEKHNTDTTAMWNKAVKKYTERYDKVDHVHTYTTEDFHNVSKMIIMLEDSVERNGYKHSLSLSKGYYKQDLFTEKTDPYLLRVGLTLSTAYVEHYHDECSKDKYLKESIDMLENDINRIKKLLGMTKRV